MKDKKEGLQENITEGYGMLSKLEGFMAQKGLWKVAEKSMLRDGGVLPEDEGDLVREYKAMHEENFLSSWLREDVEGT